METLRRLFGQLRPRINEAKSAVAHPWKRTLLGFTFFVIKKREVRRAVAGKALQTMKDRVRQITRHTGGRSLPKVIEERRYLPGWRNYFQLQQSLSLFQGLDGWIRHRLRMLQLKHWKNAATAYQALRALSLTEAEAAKVAGNLKSWLRNSEQGSAAQVIRRPGAAEASDVTSTLRTAGCGPARPVVWEGPGGAIASASL